MSNIELDERCYRHDKSVVTGALLLNLGTPKQPNFLSVFGFLRQFLSDSRVIGLPRWLWLPLLYGVILPLRSGVVAKKYADIWMKGGSPLLCYSEQLTAKLGKHLKDLSIASVTELAMTYGDPDMHSALARLKQQHVRKLIVIPLYPQYAESTTAAAFDALSHGLQKLRFLPELHFLQQYADHPLYISALATSIKMYWKQHGRGDKLLISFHGVPVRNLSLGDPYSCFCQKSSRLLVEALGLKADEYVLVFQSRFGRSEWLQPYCTEVLKQEAIAGNRHLDIVCPGFPVDCLETLHEMEIENQELFQQHGGEKLSYIPALNASDDHVQLMTNIIKSLA